jgi:hypothetical protein
MFIHGGGLMRYALLVVVLLALGAGYGWAEEWEGWEEWEEYHRDASSIRYCKNIKSVTEGDIKNVEALTRIGDECFYNYYEIDCEGKRWKQVQRASAPCGVPFLLKAGEQKWHSLNRLGLFRPDKKKLLDRVCGG